MKTVRQQALDWWNKLPFEIKWYKIIANKDQITGYPDRSPDMVSGREVELMYLNEEEI
jgi:hypothetical protein